MVLDILDRDNVDTFIRLARDVTRLHVMILCEGSEDIDTLSALIKKVNIQLTQCVGISDCGGVSKLEEFAPIVSMVCRLSKRTDKIVIILDADTSTPQARVTALKQSLESHGVDIDNFIQISDSIYGGTCGRFNFLIKAVGSLNLPFKSHEMEDYAIQLLMLEKKVKGEQLDGFSKASDFIEEYHKKANQIIEESEESHVEQAYENILSLLNRL